MQWQELSCVVEQDQANVLSDRMIDYGALSIRFEASDEQLLFRENLEDDGLWQQTRVIALFESSVVLSDVIGALTEYEQGWLSLNFREEVVEEKDWVRLTQEQFVPQLISDALWVCPTGHDIDDDKLVLKIDPGLAFGTGTHATTQLCLQWLCENDIRQKSIIDYGCGSGILSVAALLLGANEVYAIDHDEQALLATTSNATLNDIEIGKELYIQLDNDEVPKVPIIVANILAGPLKTLVGRFSELLVEDGLLIISGLLVEDVEGVRQLYTECFREIECTEQDGWARMVWVRSHCG